MFNDHNRPQQQAAAVQAAALAHSSVAGQLAAQVLIHHDDVDDPYKIFRVFQKSEFQNAAEAQNSLPKLSAACIGHDLRVHDPA